jgi:hypothetical protein
MQVSNYSIGGINLYTNPLSNQDGQVIRAVNVDSVPFGAKSKRPGYTTYNSSLTSPITDLFSWYQEQGTNFWNYAVSGGTLFYSYMGTQDWQVANNVTLTSGNHVGYAVLNNILTISQNAGTTRYSTDGTTFVDTPLAPAGEQLEQYQNRIYLTGTSADLFYSTSNDPTNWSTSGTSDSSSLVIPGAGNNNKLFKLNNRLMISKDYQNLFRWDGYALTDMASSMGITSPYSYGTVEDNGIFLNRLGIALSNGDHPVLVSNPIQPYFYNNTGSAIAGTSFDSAPGKVYRYDYYLAVGSMTDDLTNECVPNAVIKYNYLKNEFLNYSYYNFPTAFNIYKDVNGVQQLLFADSSGQVYQIGGMTDNGKPIEAVLEQVFHHGNPNLEKHWKGIWLSFNPGCQAQIMIATSNTYIKEEKNWITLGGAKEGVNFYKIPAGTRSRILYLKIVESSTTQPFIYYGCSIEADVVENI